VRSSDAARLGLATALVLAASLSLKVMATAPSHAEPAAPPQQRIGAFLAQATGQPAQAVADGWRTAGGDCWVMAFPSGPLGTLDMAARSHARRRDRVGYVYRGALRETRPTLPYAVDVIGYHLQRPFRRIDPPGYVVLVAPKACGAWPALPWRRLA
jgi:hypothetical protein